jgi:hypothetical protein
MLLEPLKTRKARISWICVLVALIALPALLSATGANAFIRTIVSTHRLSKLSDGIRVSTGERKRDRRRAGRARRRRRRSLPSPQPSPSPTAVTPSPSPSPEPSTSPWPEPSASPSPDPSTGSTLYVAADAPAGGDGSATRPFASVQEALAEAQPGDTVRIGPGTYVGEVRSVRSGSAAAPIRLLGEDAHIVGEGADHVVELTHDYLELSGLEISDGGKLIYAIGASHTRVVSNWLHDAEGECVRFKYFSVANEIAHNRIERCGLVDFDLEADSKNGEAIYIGTAPEQLSDNPSEEPDASDRNWIHHNTMVVPAECVDIKEQARANLVEHNDCRGSQDPDGAGFSSRGLDTVFVANLSSGHAGAGIRLGGDTSADGTGSVVRANRLVSNQGYGLSVQAAPQASICGNEVAGNAKGASNGRWDPAAPCPSRTTGG